MNTWSLAIDLGTSYTTAAVADEAGARVLEIDGAHAMPSLVCVDVDGELLVGRQALALAAQFPDRAVVPKQAIASDEEALMGATRVRGPDVVAAVLSEVAAEAMRRRGGSPPQRVVLTRPAYWGERELAAFREASLMAGLPSAEFLAEPLAAARHFLMLRNLAVGQYLAVYDLGAATLDVAAFRRTDEGLAWLRPTFGSLRFGGDDLDDALGAMLQRPPVAAPTDRGGGWRGDSQAAARSEASWQRAVTEAREALSSMPTVAVHQVGQAEAVQIARPAYEAAVEESLRATVLEVRTALARDGLAPEDLTAVYLTGGASRTPRIATLMTEILGVAPIIGDDPKAAIALGALAQLPAPPAGRTAPAETAMERTMAFPPEAAIAFAAPFEEAAPTTTLPPPAADPPAPPPRSAQVAAARLFPPETRGPGRPGAWRRRLLNNRLGSRGLWGRGRAIGLAALVVLVVVAAVVLAKPGTPANPQQASGVGPIGAGRPPSTPASPGGSPAMANPQGMPSPSQVSLAPMASPTMSPAGMKPFAATTSAPPPTASASPTAQATALPAALAGTWKGDELQTNLNNKVRVVLTLTAPGSAVYGAPVKCHDTLALASSDGMTAAIFTQTSTDPGCIPHATVTVLSLGNGLLSYSFNGGGIVGFGILSRR